MAASLLLAAKIDVVEAAAWFTAAGTILAVIVALSFGLQGNSRVEGQREAAAAAAVRRHNVDLLLRLFDAYAAMPGRGANIYDRTAESAPFQGTAANQVQLPLAALPDEFAIGLRAVFDVQHGLDNGKHLTVYADEGWVGGTEPTPSAIRRELAANLRQEALEVSRQPHKCRRRLLG